MAGEEPEVTKVFNRSITRRQAIKVGGIAVVGLAFAKPAIDTFFPKPAFANYVRNGQGAGCTPGYWKVPQHHDSWVGFTTGQSIQSVFSAITFALYPTIFGDYYHIEYFFYFVFNDFWNKHQSDWDSMVELYIKKDESKKFMVNHLHHCRWVTKWPEPRKRGTDIPRLSGIKEWLGDRNEPKKNEIREAMVLDDHPYVFVAEGAHGGYPTPGFCIHGLNIPGILSRDDFLTSTDEMQIGRLCILPDGYDAEMVRTNLRFADIEVNKLRCGWWKKPELVANQPWRKYEGKWGEDTRYLGWDGPKNPPISGDPNHNSLKEAIQAKYKGCSILQVWHGAR